MASKKVNKIDDEFITNADQSMIFGPLETIVSERFGAYSKYIIQDRALPDIRDGLKPVQRRILFGMNELGIVADTPYKKAARVVGDVMGKYHPHGDSSIYDAIVRMSQWWKSNEVLIDMHGNNGSLDNDPPAAMRYTEVRLSPVAMELLKNIDEETVEFTYNFDDTLKEPTVLPTRFPTLLVNGAKGIAAGFATDIPPHNLSEVVDGVIHRIKNPNCRLETMMEIIKGPDFPTGGIAFGKQGIIDAFETGKGKIVLRARSEIIENKNQRQIVITEIPYDIIKIALVKRIDEIRFNKLIWGIEEVRDESDRNGLRIVIDITKEADPQLILNFLYKESDLQTTYNYNMVAIDNKTPKQVGLLAILDAYIAHKKEVTLRKSKFNYNKKMARLHIIDGLIKAVSVIDELVETIKKSQNKANAKENIMSKFGFSEKQAEAILMLQLYRLSSTDVVKLEDERTQLNLDIATLLDILENETSLKNVMIAELREIKNRYGSERKTELRDEVEEVVIDKAATIIKEEVMVAVSRDGYAKRSQMKSYTTSNQVLPGYKQTDAIVSICQANTLDTLLLFTSGGCFIYLPVYELTENKWKDEGTHLNKIVSYASNDKIIGVIVVHEFREDLYVALASSSGYIKRTRLSEFVLQRYTKAVSCFKLGDGDSLTAAFLTNGGCDIATLYQDGHMVRYNENEVSIVGVKAGGVRSGSRSLSSKLIGGIAINDDFKLNLMLATDKGGVKPVYPRYLNVTSKNTMGTLSFKSFKSDLHMAVGVIAYDDEDRIQIVTNFKTIEIKVSDIPYQPIDKIIKQYLSLELREKVEAIVTTRTIYVDHRLKSKKIETKKPEQTFASFDDKLDDEEKAKKEKYANISIEDLFK